MRSPALVVLPLASLLVALRPPVCGAQTRLVARAHVNLRAGPSTRRRIVTVLAPGDTVTLVRPDSQRPWYVHVATAAAESGWVARSYVTRVTRDAADDSVSGTTPAAVGSTQPPVVGLDHPAPAISPQWEKFAPSHSVLEKSDSSGACPWFGGNHDRSVIELKNRADLPPRYHAVTWDALAALPWPREATTHRDPQGTHAGWSPEQLAEIAPYEREAVTVTGFVVKISKQSSNHESTNCGWTGEDNTDWHVALVGHRGQAEADAVVVEPTPRIKRLHPNWRRLADFAGPPSWSDSVRVSGWLMLDPEHKGHLGRHRSTLWEIHPVTRFEVFSGGRWVDLDAY